MYHLNSASKMEMTEEHYKGVCNSLPKWLLTLTLLCIYVYPFYVISGDLGTVLPFVFLVGLLSVPVGALPSLVKWSLAPKTSFLGSYFTIYMTKRIRAISAQVRYLLTKQSEPIDLDKTYEVATKISPIREAGVYKEPKRFLIILVSLGTGCANSFLFNHNINKILKWYSYKSFLGIGAFAFILATEKSFIDKNKNLFGNF